jgi:serine/threonine protein kinase
MNASTCNSIPIDDFLDGRLSRDDQLAFERHLDECNACCQELQRRTADPMLWNDARRFLKPVTRDPGSHPSRNDWSWSEKQTEEDSNSNASQLDHGPRLDFLGPTDDPRMLGRFAGYEISGVIGYGGMGLVLKGFDSALNRYVAIKVLAPHFASSGASRKRFAREAQAAAAVVHENVIAIHGVSEFNGLPYLVMPYVKGISLQKRIDRDGPLSTEEILRIAMQTARGLAAAHDQGLVHRDIKPGNILLPENVERVLITDFGLARAADDASLTRSGVIAGTPQYMSPEQARGEGVDQRSDLFSLGCMMYAMAVGHTPFRAETPYGILRRITDDAHRPIQEIRADIPAWLCLVIDRLLEKKAVNRFTSAADVATLLEDCLAHVQQPTQVQLPTNVIPGRMMRRHFKAIGLAVISTISISGLVLAISTMGRELSPRNDQPADNSSKQVSSLIPALEVPHSQSQSQPATSAAPVDPDLDWNEGGLDNFESNLKDLSATFDNHEPQSPKQGIPE